MTLPGDCTAGHVGAPLPCNRMKLVDVKDMNYFAENGEGEVGQDQTLPSSPPPPPPHPSPPFLTLPPSGVFLWAQRLQGVPEGPHQNSRGSGCRRLVALRRHWAMAPQWIAQDHRPQETHLQTCSGVWRLAERTLGVL